MKMRKITGMFLGIVLMAILFAATAFAVEYASLNELRERNIIKDVTYAYGYTDGYDDYSDGKPSTPHAIVNKFRRVSKQDPDWLGAELAYRYKGSYTSGYAAGYSDAKKGLSRAVSEDFLTEYDVIKAGSVQPTTTKTMIWNKWNLEEIDTEQGLENLAYEIGYTDASKWNAKAPLKIMYDLAKDESREVRDVYEWIRENRGAFIKKYKEGYADYREGAVAETAETSYERRESSKLASQQSREKQKKAAYDLGNKMGYEAGSEGEASKPQLLLTYEWVLNARYNVQTGEAESRNWYTLPEGVSRDDVAVAKADKENYIKGYREGYDAALKEKHDKEDISDEEYVYQIGYEVGQADAEEGVLSNPYTYVWKTHRYVTKPEEIYYTKLIRYNRDDYIKGYRDGYASIAAAEAAESG